jgi:hypothetical protein
MDASRLGGQPACQQLIFEFFDLPGEAFEALGVRRLKRLPARLRQLAFDLLAFAPGHLGVRHEAPRLSVRQRFSNTVSRIRK